MPGESVKENRLVVAKFCRPGATVKWGVVYGAMLLRSWCAWLVSLGAGSGIGGGK